MLSNLKQFASQLSLSNLRGSVVVLHHAGRLDAHVDRWRAAHHVHGRHHVHAWRQGHCGHRGHGRQSWHLRHTQHALILKYRK